MMLFYVINTLASTLENPFIHSYPSANTFYSQSAIIEVEFLVSNSDHFSLKTVNLSTGEEVIVINSRLLGIGNYKKIIEIDRQAHKTDTCLLVIEINNEFRYHKVQLFRKCKFGVAFSSGFYESKICLIRIGSPDDYMKELSESMDNLVLSMGNTELSMDNLEVSMDNLELSSTTDTVDYASTSQSLNRPGNNTSGVGLSNESSYFDQRRQY